jgi:hypothetical protein
VVRIRRHSRARALTAAKSKGIVQNRTVARSERFELPTLGFEVRCSIQLSYERMRGPDYQTWPDWASREMAG